MKLSERIVTHIPLNEIWNTDKIFDAARGAYLTESDIRQALRNGSVKFVVANVGDKLEWIDAPNCYTFWKHDLKGHVVGLTDKKCLEDFAGEYAYAASIWSESIQESIILLEKWH